MPDKNSNATLLFHTPQLRINNLTIMDIVESGLLTRTAGTPDYLLTFFHEPVTIWLGDQSMQLAPNTLFLWPPGEPQRFGLAQPWGYSWLHIGGQFLHEALREFHLPLLTPLPLSQSSVVTDWLTTIHSELHQAHPDAQILCNLIESLLLAVHRDCQFGNETIPSAFLDLKQYIETHFREPIRLDSLAERVMLSPSMMRQYFKHYFGMPPIEYLVQCRMRRACELLHDHALRIADVAAEVGYDDLKAFSVLFHRHIGQRPRAFRDSLRSETFQRQFQREQHAWELARLFEEGWVPVVECDFSQQQPLAAHWRVEYVGNGLTPIPVSLPDAPFRLTEKTLDLLPGPWFQLCWDESTSEAVKWELEVMPTLPDGFDLAVSLSGDLAHGYRLRMHSWNLLDLETNAHGHWEVLQQGRITLPQKVRVYRVSFWRTGNTISAELDGEPVWSYQEAFPLYGVGHQTFAFGHGNSRITTRVLRLRVFMRRESDYVDVLEPGRVLLRFGHRDDAAAWFSQVDATHPQTKTGYEAQFLHALTIPAQETTRREKVLAHIGRTPAHPYHLAALRELAFLHVETLNIPGAIDVVRELLAHGVTDETCTHVITRVLERLRVTHGDYPLADLLSLLSSLPVTSLDLSSLHLEHLDLPPMLPLTRLTCSLNNVSDLSPLSGLPLHTLNCSANAITDLSSLQGMPLHYLSCFANAITDLSPLRGMPLQELWCADNRIADLTPLAGMPLTVLGCWRNAIRDLAPIRELPLRDLNCNINAITDLTPLIGMPLQALYCSDNAIVDLSPLADMSLQVLGCDRNGITDLTPLRRLPLRHLSCGGNIIGSLAVLADQQLESLSCSACHLTDLSPLQHNPLRSLCCPDNRITDLSSISHLPLEVLDCSHNPVQDLTPLVALPLKSLVIEGYPLTHSMLHILAQLPLTSLRLDLTSAIMPVLERNSSLAFLNNHTTAHIARILPALQAALADWRTSSSGTHGTPLQQFAVISGDRAYLALPMTLSCADALSFSAFVGGRLVCPSTPERYQAVARYLQSVSNLSEGYLLGLWYNQPERTWRWHSGDPVIWHQWYQQRSIHLIMSGEATIAKFSGTLHTDAWRATPGPAYVILEWDA